MNIFQQFMEFMNNRTFCNDAEADIEEHEDKEAAFARELAALLEKYGLELQDEEDDAYEDDDYENESDEEKAKKAVAEGFKEKHEAKDEKEKAEADKKIEEAELRENKDEKEYNNSSDFDYFRQQYNKTVKAAPAATFTTIEEQRKLGKEIF